MHYYDENLHEVHTNGRPATKYEMMTPRQLLAEAEKEIATMHALEQRNWWLLAAQMILLMVNVTLCLIALQARQ